MFTLTPPATKKIADLLSTEAPGMFLRVEVIPGGCSGFKYQLYFDAEQHPTDTVVESGPVRVVLDDASAPLLDAATLDWHDSLTSSGFKIENPAASRTCGCGESFS